MDILLLLYYFLQNQCKLLLLSIFLSTKRILQRKFKLIIVFSKEIFQ